MLDKLNALVLNQLDQVGVALEGFRVGDEAIYQINGQNFKVKIVKDVPIYHKFSLIDIEVGDHIRKYGQVIGRATQPIKIGEHVHEHNLVSTIEVKGGD